MTRRWRLVTAVTVALTAVGVLLATPVPRGGSAAGAGADTLAAMWPEAQPVIVPGSLSDGSSYAPLLVLDQAQSVGLLTAVDSSRWALILADSDPADARVLQTFTAADPGSVDAITASGSRLYWLSSSTDAHGHGHIGLWTAERGGGPAQQLLADAGQPATEGGSYDLQVADGRIYWMASAGHRTQLRSVPVAGGALRARALDAAYVLTAWPWAQTADRAPGRPVHLLNVTTGQHLDVPVTAGEVVSCTRDWCRTVSTEPGGETVTLMRPDGSNRRRITTDAQGSIVPDVAALNRFEFLATLVTTNQPSASHRLALYDLRSGRRFDIALATGQRLRGHWLWWSTGANDTLTWQLLDLATLA